MAVAPRLRILATSTRPLGLTGEAAFQLAPLPVAPEAGDLGSLLDNPAVQLFRDRARLVASSFELDASNIADVATIAEALDGLPVAIEKQLKSTFETNCPFIPPAKADGAVAAQARTARATARRMSRRLLRNGELDGVGGR